LDVLLAQRFVERRLADLESGRSERKLFDDHRASSLSLSPITTCFTTTLSARAAAATRPARVRSWIRSCSNFQVLRKGGTPACHWCGGVDCLSYGAETHTPLLESRNRLAEMRQRGPKAI
jgi:hypothetical protein